MEAGVSLTAATKVGTTRSFVIIELRRCDEHRPQSRVHQQQKQWKSDSEVSEGYRTKSRNVASEPPTQIPEGSPRQHSTGVEQRKKVAQFSGGSFALIKSKVLRPGNGDPAHKKQSPIPSQYQASNSSRLQQHKDP